MSTVVGDAAGRWPMRLYRTLWLFASLISFGPSSAAFPASQAEEQLLIAYGSVSETNVPLWLGIERGFFKKQGIGARMVQVSGGPLIMAALASGDVQVASAAVSSVLSAASGGAEDKLLRLMTTVDIGPNPEAFKSAQKILLRLNPKIGQVELERIVDGSLVRSLEESGFLPQMRKRMGSYLRP